MTFERAKAEDAGAILRIFRETFEAQLVPCVPLGCTGAKAFVEETLNSPLRPIDSAWMVARDATVRAFAEFRLFPDSLFLNYVHVDPTSQGKGIGKRLFAASLDQLVSNRDVPITLDVSEKNTWAKDWYRNLGFRQKAQVIWKKYDLKSGPAPDFFVSGMPQALRIHEAYGFSSFNIKTDDGVFEIGRLGNELFRTMEPGLVESPILRAIEPNRKLLLISSRAPAGGEELSRRARLTASSAEIHKALLR